MGVILAGGRGTRMHPFSDAFPKPLLPICNRPLMEYQIEMLKSAGIRDIIILIGYCGFEIVRTLGTGELLGVNIKYVEQKSTLGIAHALGQLEPHIDQPFLLFLGDIYFAADNLASMVQEFVNKDANAVLATKNETNREAIKRNFAVMEEGGWVKRVIEKPRYVVNNLKGCGIYLFDLHIFDAIRRTPRTAMRDEYELTDSIQILIDDGLKVCKAEVVQEDINLTFPEDLLFANLLELTRRNAKNLLGNGAVVQNPDLIENSIIGDYVYIEHPIRVTNSIVFKRCKVSSIKDIDLCIVSPSQSIQFNGKDLREKLPEY